MISVMFKSRKRSIYLFVLCMFLFVGIASAQQNRGGADVYLPVIAKADIFTGEAWPTVAANPGRTSWTSNEVTGALDVVWYRPIEAYIPQNVQLIADHGLIYVSTSKGLYALNATNGSTAWRYDTQLPLGNAPTIADGILYVGGHDRKLHALNATTGQHLWSFNGAGSGYDTNPLVVNGKVFAGNRDGNMYAIGAHGTANQGQLIWQYATDGAIHLSAAYHNGVIYFASNDMHAYALNANSGNLVWKSDTLPGMQFQSFWPVIYRDKVIFSVAHGYREDRTPGLRDVEKPGGGHYGHFREMQLDNIFPEGPQIFDDPAPAQSWAHGFPAVNANRITEYLEDDPQPHIAKHKPWRRMYVVLNQANGQEFTFDSDNDGHPEYIPVAYWGTGSGNRYPPIVGSDNILYHGNIYDCCSDSKGRIMGWNIDTPQYLSFLGPIAAPLGGFGALAEPQAISAGGDIVYRNLCCDRVGDWVNYMGLGGPGQSQAWSYNLDEKAPGYDSMWFVDPGSISRHRGWYQGSSNSMNGAYHNHGDQNPIIPYQERLFVHRSNAIIAFGASGGPGQVAPLMANTGQNTAVSLSEAEMRARLEDEVQKIMDAGHLRPGYYNMAQFLYPGLVNYYENPGDTLYTLSIAYPHLSSGLKAQVQTYLQTYFNTYFDNEMYARTGWNWNDTPREDMDLPPEVAASLQAGEHPPSMGAGGGWIWQYPQHNFYAMWKYAQNVPGVNAQAIYNLACPKLTLPPPNPPQGSLTDYFRQQPYELNAWIAGYEGLLNLQELAGMTGDAACSRSQITNELNNLTNMRLSNFSKNSYWADPHAQNYNHYKKKLDISRNFMFLVPELAAQMSDSQVQTAVDEYEYIAPYWFVSRYEGTLGEGIMANLYISNSLIRAKALVLGESQAELSKYLDVPAFARGDLMHIQNLVIIIEAP